MDMKRFSAAALSLSLALSLSGGTLAADRPAGWTPADGARLPEVVDVPLGERYMTQLFLNGQALDAAGIPAAAPKLLPMRLLCEADGGSADWFQEENQGFFYLADRRIIVNFSDNSVELDGERVEGVTATLTEGVTFLPADFVNTLEGVEVNMNLELDVDRVDIATPNGTPLMKLAGSILEAVEMGKGMKADPKELEEYYGEPHGFQASYMTEGVAFLPMMINPDTLILGKIAPGQEQALRDSLESYRKQQEDTFTWYLPQNLPKTQNAQFVTEGDWFMFLIADNAQQAVELFRTGVSEMK